MLMIREATTADCGLIHDLAWQVFPQTYKDILSQEQSDYMMHWMYDVENLERQMTEEGNVFFIAYDGERPAGYVSVRPDGEDVFHLEKIYVLPEYQEKHYGSALFRRVLDYVRQRSAGACAVELNVNRNNPALDFYRRMGMHIDREGDFDIGHGFYMNDYIMRIEL